jgi:hypothetical protein
MGLTAAEWTRTHNRRIKQELGLAGLRHTHHAGEDAVELAQVFAGVLTRQFGDESWLGEPSSPGPDTDG